MKKRFLGLCLASVLLAGGLASCSGSSRSSSDYEVVNSMMIAIRADVTAFNGKVTSVSYDAVELPVLWAQLEKENDSVATEKVTEDGVTHYVASSIKVGDYVFKLQDEEETGMLDGYRYYAVDPTISPTEDRSLESYLGRASANAQWYYECVKNGNIAVLDKSGKAVDSSLLTHTDYFFGDENYNGVQDVATWKSNTEALSSFFVNTLQVIYPLGGTDETKKAVLEKNNGDKNNPWKMHLEWAKTVNNEYTEYKDLVDTVLTGVKFTGMSVLRSHYTAANKAFGNVELASYPKF